MKSIAVVLLLATCGSLAIDDNNFVAAGDWSQPVATHFGHAIRGRLLICDTPDHARSEPRTDTAVYLELQEFSSAVRSVRVYCKFSRVDGLPGLDCELRDRNGNVIPNSPSAFSGSEPGNYWLTLQPYCSARERASVFGGGRLEDGGLAVYLASGGWWNVHPNATNEYFLSGTFTASAPTNQLGMVTAADMDVWHGTLKLPPVKIPMRKR